MACGGSKSSSDEIETRRGRRHGIPWNFHDLVALVCVHDPSAAMAARKLSRRKRASSVGRTVESSVLELKKSRETLRRMLESYLPSRTRRRSSKTTTRRNLARSPKRTGTRRSRRTKRVA
jgi:hypothetical protein